MTNLAAFLISLAWPIVKRVLVALGIGYVSYSGISLIEEQARNLIIAQWGQLGNAATQIASLAGINTAIGIVLSAISVRVVFIAGSKLARVV